MFGIGMPELVLILAVALIVLGPRKLPEIARSLGKAMREFKKAADDLRSAVNLDDDIKGIKRTINDVKGDVRDMAERYIDEAPPESGPVTDQKNKDEQTPTPDIDRLVDGALPADGKIKDE